MLQEDECRQLAVDLDLQTGDAFAARPKDDDDTNGADSFRLIVFLFFTFRRGSFAVEVETETEVYATARESASTPRSPRDASSSNVSSSFVSRSALLCKSTPAPSKWACVLPVPKKNKEEKFESTPTTKTARIFQRFPVNNWDVQGLEIQWKVQ